MALFLVFHRNVMTGDDFTTPVEAVSKDAAISSLSGRYPNPAYVYLTCFEKAALQGILEDADRWPGVASTPQPTLEQLLSRVTARVGKLPPLPNRQPVEQPAVQVAQATGGRVENITPTPVAVPVPTAPRTLSMAEALKAMKAPVVPVSASKPKAAKMEKTPSSLAASANANRSVIDVLRALKG